ncbi:uncharacterized protein LOC128207773 isoform X1 [Mya arenaria]|uniref:uncharacterized protein LOC128207773 isoform X1 n=1 Tax=Mya arenaria TaxID=6604 RepID=UPI0022E2F982|nr:uncharacterized protein LOC128207773 isoform X1 [Mya arenaria]
MGVKDRQKHKVSRKKKTESASDIWRRVEQTGLDNTLKKIATVKGELKVISSISSDDAVNLSSVITEMNETLGSIRHSFVDNEAEIYDGDEHELKYLTSSCPAIVSIWSQFSIFASDFATSFVQKSWLNSSEHRQLLNNVVDLAGNAVKLVVLAVDTSKFHNLDEASELLTASRKESEDVSKSLQQHVPNMLSVGEGHSAAGGLWELLGWMLYGLKHVTHHVLQPDIDKKEPDVDLSMYDELTGNLYGLFQILPEEWTAKAKAEEKPPSPPAPSQNKKNSKKTTKTATKEPSKEVKEVSIAPPPEENNQKSGREGFTDAATKLGTACDRYTASSWDKQCLPVLRGHSGEEVRFRMSTYKELGGSFVDPSPMALRRPLLDSLQLTEDHTLQSDIYYIGPEGLKVTEEVIVQFPLFSATPVKGIFLMVRDNGAWSKVEDPEVQVTSEDGAVVVFRTTSCEAFTALSQSCPDRFAAGPAGAEYVSPEHSKVGVIVPKDCFDTEVELDIKVEEFDKQKHSYHFIGIECASVALTISCGSDVKMLKPITIELPVEVEDKEKDTDLVVVRYNNTTCQVLDYKQYTVKGTSKDDVFAVDIKEFWCVALLHIRRVFLNMRETIKKEFLVGYGKRVPCNILTYIDDTSRDSESQIFVTEILDSYTADTEVETKRSSGIIEVKKSRSKDVFLQRGDLIRVEIDGQMRITEAMSEEEQTICFLPGCSNSVSFHTEVKRDPEKLPDAMLFFKTDPEQSIIHTLAILTRDLCEQATEEITARSGSNSAPNENKKNEKREEAAVNILKMESLMTLARELTLNEARELGIQLGLKPDVLKRIQEDTEKDRVASNFQILCKWRGRFARATMADFLVSSLKGVGKVQYADILVDVRRLNRGLVTEDFRKTKYPALKN